MSWLKYVLCSALSLLINKDDFSVSVFVCTLLYLQLVDEVGLHSKHAMFAILVRTGLLCLFFTYYATYTAVLKILTYYAQYYAHLCLLEYIDLYY